MFRLKPFNYAAVKGYVETMPDVRSPYRKLFKHAVEYDLRDEKLVQKLVQEFSAIRVTSVNEKEAIFLFLSILVAACKMRGGLNALKDSDIAKFFTRVMDKRYAAAVTENWIEELFRYFYVKDYAPGKELPKEVSDEFKEFKNGFARCKLFEEDIFYEFESLLGKMLPTSVYGPIEVKSRKMRSKQMREYEEEAIMNNYSFMYRPGEHGGIEEVRAERLEKAREDERIENARAEKAAAKRKAEQSKSLEKIESDKKKKREQKVFEAWQADRVNLLPYDHYNSSGENLRRMRRGPFDLPFDDDDDFRISPLELPSKKDSASHSEGDEGYSISPELDRELSKAEIRKKPDKQGSVLPGDGPEWLRHDDSLTKQELWELEMEKARRERENSGKK